MPLYLGKHCRARLVNDGVHLLNDIEVGLVVGISHSTATPRNRRQLTRGQNGADTA